MYESYFVTFAEIINSKMFRQNEQQIANLVIVAHTDIALLNQLGKLFLLARHILALRLALGDALLAPLDELHVDKPLIPRLHAAAGDDPTMPPWCTKPRRRLRRWSLESSWKRQPSYLRTTPPHEVRRRPNLSKSIRSTI